MKSFLYEMHAHTSESSSCAHQCARDVVEHYKAIGYDGIVFTDHMSTYKMNRKGLKTVEEKAEYFLAGYREAKKYETEDFNVLLGMEMCFTEFEGDFLIYGLTEELLYEYHWDCFKNLEEFRPVAEKHGLLVFQAHPFRFDMAIQDPELLDGMEVYNGNPNHDSNNDIASLWANKYGLRRVSGTDYHGDTGTGPSGGLLFKRRVTDTALLCRELRNRDYAVKDE